MARAVLFCVILSVIPLFAQEEIPPQQDPEQQSEAPQQNANRDMATQPPAVPPSRDVEFNIKSFAKNFGSDQKKIWTFPVKVATGHHLVPVLAVAGLTAGIVAGVDPPAARYFRRRGGDYDRFNSLLSEHVTTSATLLGPAALCVGGLIGKDRYLAHTGLLALEAWVDVDIVGEAMRNIARRRRPLDVPPGGSYNNTWFKTGGNPLNSSGSFPSGHTAWGFAVATVVARRYPQHKWVRYLVYGLATVDAVSRVTSSNHFVSDTAFGAALGYSIGRFVVVRQ
jgi:PAP2 superfamily